MRTALILITILSACAKPVAAPDQREAKPSAATAERTAAQNAADAPPPEQAEASENPAASGGRATNVAPPTAAGANATLNPKVTVDGEGLRLVDPTTGRATPLAFGLREKEVVATLERLRGAAARGTNGECGAGPLRYANWADGLSLLFKDARFVGWSLDRRAAGAIATMAGIGPSSTRRDLEAVYVAKFSETTIGTEFAAGGLGGVLDGSSAGARISAMWGGTTCIFR